MRGGLVPSISGILTAYSGSHRVTGTPRAVLSGEGALYLPPQALFHTHLSFVSRPRFFLFFFLSRWPSGPRMECLTLLAAMQNSERCSENTPELSECHSERHALRDPHPSPANFGRIRGKCCAFFYGAVFREIPLIVLAFFFYSSTPLSFFVRQFSGTNSCAGVGRGESWFFVNFPRNV